MLPDEIERLINRIINDIEVLKENVNEKDYESLIQEIINTI